MTERLRRAGQVAWAIVGLAALVALIGLVAWTVRVIFPPLILAGAIVFLLNPVVTVLQQRGIPRAAGAALSYLGVIGIIALVGLLVVPLASSQAEQLGDDWPGIRQKSERWIDARAEQSDKWLVKLPTVREIEREFDSSNVTLREQFTRARRIGLRIFHVLLILILAPILGFYLLVDVPHLRRVSEGLIPDAVRAEVLHVAHRLNRAIGGFFRGQLMVALIVGVMCSVGLAIIGLRFWFLVGMIAGLFNIVPLIGPWIGGIPGVMIALTTGSPVKALLVVAIMAGAQQVDNHFITPQVMQRAVRLHPAAVMLALLAGGTLGGFFGLLLAVPTAAVLKIIAGHLWHMYVLEDHMEVEERPGVGMVEDVGKESGALPVGEPAAAPSTMEPVIKSG